MKHLTLKQTLLIPAISLCVVACGWLSQPCNSTLNAINQRDTIGVSDSIIDNDNNGVHDDTCMCGYCTEVYYEDESNYYRIVIAWDSLKDSTSLFLVDNLTNDTIADISHDRVLQTIIDKDNQ